MAQRPGSPGKPIMVQASRRLHAPAFDCTFVAMEQPTAAHSTGVDASDPTALKILDAALEILAKSGIGGTTTRAIAEAADVNEVTLFRRFGTKMDLLRIAISHRLDATMRTSAEYTGDLDRDLIRLAREYRNALATFGPLARVIFSEVAHTPDLRSSVETAQRFYRAIAELFQRYHEQGNLEAEPVWWTVTSFLGPLAMPFVINEIAPEEAEFPFDARLYVQRFLDGRRV